MLGLVRPGSTVCDTLDRAFSGNLLDFRELSGILREAAPDVVIHGSFPRVYGSTADERLELARDGILGAAVLLEAARATGVPRLIHFGSSTIYGGGDNMRESQSLRPVSARGAAKSGVSLLIQQAGMEGYPAFDLRLFRVYGPGDRSNGFIVRLLNCAHSGDRLPIAPGERRDYVYAGDVFEACRRVCFEDLPPGLALNIGYGLEWTTEEVVALAERVTGHKVRVAVGGFRHRSWEPEHWQANLDETERWLRWRPAVGLEEGLRITNEWYLAPRKFQACAV